MVQNGFWDSPKLKIPIPDLIFLSSEGGWVDLITRLLDRKAKLFARSEVVTRLSRIYCPVNIIITQIHDKNATAAAQSVESASKLQAIVSQSSRTYLTPYAVNLIKTGKNLVFKQRDIV